MMEQDGATSQSPLVSSALNEYPCAEALERDGLEIASSIGRFIDTHDFRSAISLFQSANPLALKDALLWQDSRGDSLLHKVIDAHAQLRFKSAHDGIAEQLIVMLLKKNANPNAVNIRRQTPLHAAAMGGNMDLCKVLIRYKARLDVVDSRGKRPEDTARHHRHQQLAEFLQQHAVAAHVSLDGSGRQDGARSPSNALRHAVPPQQHTSVAVSRLAVQQAAPPSQLGDRRSLADRYHDDEARRLRESQEMKWRLEDLRDKNHALHSTLYATLQAHLVASHRCGAEKLHELEDAAFTALLTKAALAAESTQLEEQLRTLSSELQVCSDTLSSTSLLKDQLAETVEELNAERKESMSTVSAMMEELEALRHERVTLKEQVAQLEGQSAATSTALATTTEELRQAITTCTAIMDERDAAVAQAAKHEAHVSELTIAVGNMDAAIRAATTRGEGVDALNIELASAISQLTALQEDYATQAVLLQSQIAENEAMRLAVDNLQQDLRQMTDARDALVQNSAAELLRHEEAVKQLEEAKNLLADQLAAAVAAENSGSAGSDAVVNVEWQDRCRRMEDKLAVATQQLAEKESRLAAMGTVQRIHVDGAAAAQASAEAAEVLSMQRLQMVHTLEAKLRTMGIELERATQQLAATATANAKTAVEGSPGAAEETSPPPPLVPASAAASPTVTRDDAALFQRQVQQLQAEKADALQSIRLLEGRLVASHHESEARRVDVETWKRKSHDATVAVEKLQHDATVAAEKLEHAGARIQRLEDDNAALAQQLASIKPDVHAQEDNAQLLADVSSLRLELHTMRSNRQVGMSELQEQTARAESLEQRLGAMESVHQQLSASHRIALLRLEDMERLQGDNAVLQGELNEMRRRMHDTETTVTVLEHDHRYQTERIQFLEAQLIQERRCFAAVEEQVTSKGLMREEELWRREVMVAQLNAAMVLQHNVASCITVLAVRALQASSLRSSTRQQGPPPLTVRKSFDPANSELPTTSSIAVRAVSSLRHHVEPPHALVDRGASTSSCCHSTSTTNDDEELGITHDDSADDLLPPPAGVTSTQHGAPVASPPELPVDRVSAASRPFQRNRPSSAVVGSRQSQHSPLVVVAPGDVARLGIRYETHPSGLLWSTSHNSIRAYYVNQCGIHGVKPLAAVQDMLPDEELQLGEEGTAAAGAQATLRYAPPTTHHAASKLTVLSVAHGKQLCRASVRALIDLLRVCPRLQTLDFSGTSVSDASLAYLVATVEAMLGFVAPTPYSDDDHAQLVACRERAVQILALKEVLLDGTLVSNIDHITHVAALVPTLTSVSLTRCKLLRDTSRPALEAQLRANATTSSSFAGGACSASAAIPLVARPDPAVLSSGLSNQMGLHLGRFRRPASAATVRPNALAQPPSLPSPSKAAAAGRHQSSSIPN